MDPGFSVTFSGGECENLRIEEHDPNFPQQAALRSPLLIKCDISFEDSSSGSFELQFTIPNDNMGNMAMDSDEGMDSGPAMFSGNDMFDMSNVEPTWSRSDAGLTIHSEDSGFLTRKELLAEIRSSKRNRKRRANGKL